VKKKKRPTVLVEKGLSGKGRDAQPEREQTRPDASNGHALVVKETRRVPGNRLAKKTVPVVVEALFAVS